MSKESEDPAGHGRPPGNRSTVHNALSQFRAQNPFSFPLAPSRPQLSASSGIGIFTSNMHTPPAPSSSNEGPVEGAAVIEQNQDGLSHVTVRPIKPLETNEDVGEDLAADVGPDADNIGQLGGRENDFGMDRQKSSQSG
ncbi:hypothetical protein H9Q73_006547 [Fusarium xylarioides]|nr:hypothetical protein H9Q73_006547 [Fusarium xylarioides]